SGPLLLLLLLVVVVVVVVVTSYNGFPLPIAGVQALRCQRGTIETEQDVLELPFSWTGGQKTCEVSEGCQDTLMIIENGPKLNLVLIKGCTTAEDQEPRVTRHRAGPGLSIISYTHVCRHADFCNDLSLWVPPTNTGARGRRC
uniref:CD177 antigen n=1 Tax=Castor canadensis TaxID=51338 RepID=A0A8C0X2I8_CASCN